MTGHRGETDLWRVEEACANAYPSWRELRLGAWVLRAAGGLTRRINSVNPLHAGATDPERLVDDAAAVYGRLGQPTLFRLPDLVTADGAALERLGFRREGDTLTLMADLAVLRPTADPAAVVLALVPAEPWFGAWRRLRSDVDDAAAAGYRRSLEALAVPAAFACRSVDGEPVAVAYAALHRGLAVLESVVTHADHRGQGHARAVVGALLAWSAGAGASAACLQVEAGNAPARALYAGAGFTRELYRYRYFRR